MKKVSQLETQKVSYREEMRQVGERFNLLNSITAHMEEFCQAQQWSAKVFRYKSIDSEARSTRNKVIINGLTERMNLKDTCLQVLIIKLNIDTDTSEMKQKELTGKDEAQMINIKINAIQSDKWLPSSER